MPSACLFAHVIPSRIIQIVPSEQIFFSDDVPLKQEGYNFCLGHGRVHFLIASVTLAGDYILTARRALLVHFLMFLAWIWPHGVAIGIGTWF